MNLTRTNIAIGHYQHSLRQSQTRVLPQSYRDNLSQEVVPYLQGDLQMVKKLLNKSVIALVKEYAKVVNDHGIKTSQFIVFGSQAKGTAKDYSDIDLCVVSPTFGKNSHTEMVKLINLRGLRYSNIEPYPYHPKYLTVKLDPLASEIRKYGIPITI